VFKILSVFGIYEEGDFPSVAGGNQGSSKEEIVAPYMNALRDYRDEIKKNAKDPKAMFEISDNLRDDILPQLGIRLDDKG